MTRRREVQQAVIDMAASLGASVTFEYIRSGHIRAVLTYAGRSRFKVAAKDARRVLQSMGAPL
jgi:EAL domain-containing protein (putative c-di-GMP-specific phosphodiesterase class I)